MNPVVFVGHWSFDCVSFAINTPISDIICCGYDNGEIAKQFLQTHIHSLEKEVGVRECWTSAHLDWSVNALWKHIPSNSTPYVVAFSSSMELEKLLSEGKIKGLFVNSQRIKNFFDNKMLSKRLFRQLHLPQPTSQKILLTPQSIDNAINVLGVPCVVRKRFSFMGTGVFPINDKDNAYHQLMSLGFSDNEMIIVEQFVDGMPLNINAVAFADGNVHCYPPSVQLIGLKGYTTLPFGFCGSDYVRAQFLTLSVKEACQHQVQAIGNYMSRLGYRGIFGVDFLLTPDNRVLPCEINPRMQTSTSLLNWTYKATSHCPALLHLESFGYEAEAIPDIQQESYYSQVIAHVMKNEAGCTVTAQMDEGKYRFDAHSGHFKLTEKTLIPLNLQPNEIIIAGSPPPVGNVVKSGSPLFKIILKQSVTDNGFSLKDTAFHNALLHLKDKLTLKKLDQ